MMSMTTSIPKPPTRTKRKPECPGARNAPAVFLASLACWLGFSGAARAHLEELRDVAGRFGLNYGESGSGNGHVAHLRSQWTDLGFGLHDRYAMLNGLRVYLGRPVARDAGRFYIDDLDEEGVLRPLLAPQVFAPIPKLYRIVLDPGHGGRDPGAVNEQFGLDEKTLALDISLRLRGFLREYGYDVHLTRAGDTYPTLDERAALANRVNADLFLSIHFNAVATPSVDGVETYVMTLAGHPSTNSGQLTASARQSHPGNANDPWNALVGYYLQRQLVENLAANDRGLRRARFSVLRQVECPAALVECGFITHPASARKIATPAYRDRIARALLAGVLDYQKRLNALRE